MDMRVRIGSLELANPIISASGPLGFGEDISYLCNLSSLGAFTTKTLTLEPREGNSFPRVIKVGDSYINSVGLANPGWGYFCEYIVPHLRKFPCPVIVSVHANNKRDLAELVDNVLRTEVASAIEINVSCPNVSEDYISLCDLCAFLLNFGRRVPVILKTDAIHWEHYLGLAQAYVVDVDRPLLADAVCIGNSLPATSIDVTSRHRRRPAMGSNSGGLSGPAVKYINLCAIGSAIRKSRVQIIGCGGIRSGLDVVEYLCSGASAVQVGAAFFGEPDVGCRILSELEDYFIQRYVDKVDQLVGVAWRSGLG